MKKMMVFIFSLTILAGCATVNFQPYYKYTLTPDQKTMLVPLGINGVIGAFKNSLRNSGWKLIALDSGSINTTGTVGNDTDLVSQYNSQANFHLVIVSHRSNEYCLSGFYYEASIVDLKTGQEAMAISGNGCLDNLVSDFTNAVDQTFEDSPTYNGPEPK